MTTVPIDEAPACRELNALVAEKMTGWKPWHDETRCDGEKFIRCNACGAFGHGNCYGDGRGAIQIECGEHIACCDEAMLPDYCTDIAAAWQVDRGEWAWFFAEYSDLLQVQVWYRDDLRLRSHELNQPLAIVSVKWEEVETRAGAYALARCRAALKAVGVAEIELLNGESEDGG